MLIKQVRKDGSSVALENKKLTNMLKGEQCPQTGTQLGGGAYKVHNTHVQ